LLYGVFMLELLHERDADVVQPVELLALQTGVVLRPRAARE
jgi:hypothetical protein